MSAGWIGLQEMVGPEDARPMHDRVVAFSDRCVPIPSGRHTERSLVRGPAILYSLGRHFTPADQATMVDWARDGGHGYDRLRVERGSLEDETLASYALVYVPGLAWSTWGLMRRDGQVEVWRCATGKTIGRHVRMVEALASLPHAAGTASARVTEKHAEPFGLAGREPPRARARAGSDRMRRRMIPGRDVAGSPAQGRSDTLPGSIGETP